MSKAAQATATYAAFKGAQSQYYTSEFENPGQPQIQINTPIGKKTEKSTTKVSFAAGKYFERAVAQAFRDSDNAGLADTKLPEDIEGLPPTLRALIDAAAANAVNQIIEKVTKELEGTNIQAHIIADVVNGRGQIIGNPMGDLQVAFKQGIEDKYILLELKWQMSGESGADVQYFHRVNAKDLFTGARSFNQYIADRTQEYWTNKLIESSWREALGSAVGDFAESYLNLSQFFKEVLDKSGATTKYGAQSLLTNSGKQIDAKMVLHAAPKGVKIDVTLQTTAELAEKMAAQVDGRETRISSHYLGKGEDGKYLRDEEGNVLKGEIYRAGIRWHGKDGVVADLMLKSFGSKRLERILGHQSSLRSSSKQGSPEQRKQQAAMRANFNFEMAINQRFFLK